MPINVLLADDHAMVRDGLKMLLEQKGFKVNADSSNGQEAVETAKKWHPEVVVLDITMPVLNGMDAAREILQDAPDTKTILLSMHKEKEYVLEGLRIGIKGFVTKTHATDELTHAIREVVDGRTYLSSEVSQAVIESYQLKNGFSQNPLSPRERQVLQLVAEGKTTKELAVVLHISPKTVETHRARLMEKLNIHETAGLVRYAIRLGLVCP